MLFLHLFNDSRNFDLCVNYVSIGGIPLVNLLTRACYPVPFFLIISGYGLHASSPSFRRQLIRVAKLYLCYWVTLLVFVSVGSYVRPEKYPGSWVKVILNVLGYRFTYNDETWFLLPYALNALASGFYFRLLKRYGRKVVLALSFVISTVSAFMTSFYGNDMIPKPVYELCLVFNLMFAFMVGAVLHDVHARGCGNGLFGRLYKRLSPLFEGRSSWFYIMILVLLIVLKIIVRTNLIDGFYALAFIVVFLKIKRPEALNATLAEIGSKSMVMWLIHTYFCYYLFHDWIYGFRYPLLIFAIMLLLTYLASILIMFITKKIYRLLSLEQG